MLRSAFRSLYQRDAVLAIGGLSQVVATLIVVPLLFLDSREVLGINVWIKPIKFFLSATIYLWTLAILLSYLKARYPRSVRFIGWSVTVAMVVENVAITYQAARGVRSHFNEASLLDGMIFSLMGLFILWNTLVILYSTVLFFRSSCSLPSAYIWGIRLGFVLFILGSSIGGAMVGAHSHNVGVEMGEAGLPFLNWSMLGGDLRIAHFMGLHSLQIIPLAGYLLSRNRAVKPGWATVGIATIALLYGVTVFGLYQQAMGGTPLISGR